MKKNINNSSILQLNETIFDESQQKQTDSKLTTLNCTLTKDIPHEWNRNSPNIKVDFLPQAQKIGDENGTQIQISNSLNIIKDSVIYENIQYNIKDSSSLRESFTHNICNYELHNHFQENQLYESKDKCLYSEFDMISKGHRKNAEKDTKSQQFSFYTSIVKRHNNSEQQVKKNVEVQVVKKNKLLESIKRKTVNDVWQRNWLQIIYYTSKMKKMAKQIKLFHQPFMLQPFQVRMINDVSSNQDIKYSYDKYSYIHLLNFDILKQVFSSKKYRWLIKKISIQIGLFLVFKMILFKYFESLFSMIFKYMPLFHNLSRFYFVWETIIFITCFINFIYLPFEYSFLYERSYLLSLHISIVTPLILALDIFIKFNTKSYEQGTNIEQHIEIAKNYIQSHFIMDLISMVCLNYQIFDCQASYFLFFLRFFRSTRIIELFREQFLLNVKISGMISLIFLFTLALYYSHLFACTWNAIGLYEAKFNQGWLVFYHINTLSIWQMYTDSLYFSIVTMTTIGYGDMTAQSNIEKLLMIFFAFLSCGVFGYSINSIGYIPNSNFFLNLFLNEKSLSKKNQIHFRFPVSLSLIKKIYFKIQRDKYLQELAKINQYFKQYDVSLTLQGSARRYLEYLYSDERQDQFCSISLISNLSEHLQVEIKKDIFTKRLKFIKLFKENFKEEFLLQLSLKMQENIYSSDQIILNSLDDCEPCIRIINSGTVLKYAQYDTNSEIKPIEKLEFGKQFGMSEFFLDSRHSEFCYKSVEITSILSLNLSDFMSVVKQFNDQQEIFQYLRDQVKFQKSFHKIFTYCPSCKQKDHFLTECQYIFYEGKKSAIIQSYLKKCKLENDTYQRNPKRFNCHALTQKQFISKKIEIFQENHIHELSDYEMSSSDYDNYDDEDDDIGVNQLQGLIENIQISRKKTEADFKSQEKILEDLPHQSNQVQGTFLQAQNFSKGISRRKRTLIDRINTQEDYMTQFSNYYDQNEKQDGSFRILNGVSQSIIGSDVQYKQSEFNNNNNNPLKLFHINLMNKLKEIKNQVAQIHQTMNQLQTQKSIQKVSYQKIKTQEEKKQLQKAASVAFDKRKIDDFTLADPQENNLDNLYSKEFDKIEKYDIYYPFDNYDLIVEKVFKLQFGKKTVETNSKQNEGIKVLKKKKKYQ